MENLKTIHYEYCGKQYEITAGEDFHEKLRNDDEFATHYFHDFVEQEIGEVNSINNSMNEIATMNGNTTGETTNSRDIEDDSLWRENDVKLLLDEYKSKVHKFRNPKIKKITLWRQMSQNFKKHGLNFSAEKLEKKFRNMKQTYMKIKKNNSRRTTGAGRISWPYVAPMDEIFTNDESIILTNNVISTLPLTSGPVNLSVDRKRSENSIDDQTNEDSQGLDDYTKDNLREIKEKMANGTGKNGNNVEKNSTARKLYSQRNRLLQLDAEKNEILKTITANAENSNTIMAENLAIWRQTADSIIKVLKEKTEVEIERNKLLSQRNSILQNIANKSDSKEK